MNPGDRRIRALIWLLLAAIGAGVPLAQAPAAGSSGMDDPARKWLETHRQAVLAAADSFGVDAVAAGAILAVELTQRTMLDDLEEEYVRTLLRDKDEAFFLELARNFVSPPAESEDVSTLDRMLYFCSLGPAQIQVRVALEMEPLIAAARKRASHTLRQTLTSLLDNEDTLDYLCAVLKREMDAYRENAGIDISHDVGVLATVYNLGSPVVRARQLKKKSDGRPQPGENDMGRLAESMTVEVRRILYPENP